MRHILLHILTLWSLIGCTSPKYGVSAPVPTLSIDTNENSYALNKTYIINIEAIQQGVDGTFTLSAVILSGKATLSIDGIALSSRGEWTALTQNPAKLAITPTVSGELTLYLQVKSPEGIVSDKQFFRASVAPPSDFLVSVEYESEIVNPNSDTRIPIQINIENSAYSEDYTITASLKKGQGKFYVNGFVVNDTEFKLKSTENIYLVPEKLGEYIIEFVVKDKSNSIISAQAYIQVLHEIVINYPNVSDSILVTGSGSYYSEGEKAHFTLVGNEDYNFEVQGWYDSRGKLLSADSEYTMTISYNSPTEVYLLFKQRTVKIKCNDIASEEFKYHIYEDGKVYYDYYYDWRTSLSADYKITDPIRFNYQEFRYNTSLRPPIEQMRNKSVDMAKDNDWAGYFYRRDKTYHISITQKDNPDFTFNFSDHSIVSGSTRYVLPPNVTIK